MKERLEGKYDRVFVSHGTCDADPAIMADMSGLCDDVMAGNTDDIPFEFMET